MSAAEQLSQPPAPPAFDDFERQLIDLAAADLRRDQLRGRHTTACRRHVAAVKAGAPWEVQMELLGIAQKADEQLRNAERTYQRLREEITG